MSFYQQSESTAAYRWIMFRCFDDDSADGYAPKTGLTFSNGELKIAKPGQAYANATGYASVVEAGHGKYWYPASADELNTLGVCSLVVNKTDVYAEDVDFQVVPWDPYDVNGLGLSRIDANISTRLPTSSYQDNDELLAKTIGTKSLSLLLHLVGAMVGAKRTVTPDTFILRDLDDTVNLVTASIDGTGNVTNVVIVNPDE